MEARMAGGWSFGRAARDCAGSLDGAGSVNSRDDQLFGIATTGGGAFAVGDDQDGAGSTRRSSTSERSRHG
jgi:hypothetical protein